MGKRKLLTKLTYNELNDLQDLCYEVSSDYRAVITLMSDDKPQFVIFYLDFENKYDIVAYGNTYNEIVGQFQAYIRGKHAV